MAQFYTLDEAARILGIAPEALKAKAQSREVSAFLDGGSWRFRVVDIDELARRHGLGSDAELRLSDLEVPAGATHLDDAGEKEDFDLSEFHVGTAPPDVASRTGEFPRVSAVGSDSGKDIGPSGESAGTGSNHDLLLDDLSVPPSPVAGLSSMIVGMASGDKDLDDLSIRPVVSAIGQESDNDLFLASPDPDHPKIADHAGFTGESDVLLELPDPDVRPQGDSDVALINDDLRELAGETSPMLGSSSELDVVEAGSSSAELKPPVVTDALKPDSGSDFELTVLDAGDDLDSAPLAAPSDSDVTAAGPQLSGIDLSQPNDSGINLHPGSGIDLSKATSIGLAPLSDDEIKPLAASAPAASPEKPKKGPAQTPPRAAAAARIEQDEDEDFDLTPSRVVADRDDPTEQLEAPSDFELDELDSGSEVFGIDEEGDSVDQNAATALAATAEFEDDEDEELTVARLVVQQGADANELASMAEEMLTTVGGPQHRRVRIPTPLMTASPDVEYTGLTIALLSIAALLLVLTAFVGFDLAVHGGMNEEGSVASGLIRQLAGLFGG